MLIYCIDQSIPECPEFHGNTNALHSRSLIIILEANTLWLINGRQSFLRCFVHRQEISIIIFVPEPESSLGRLSRGASSLSLSFSPPRPSPYRLLSFFSPLLPASSSRLSNHARPFVVTSPIFFTPFFPSGASSPRMFSNLVRRAARIRFSVLRAIVTSAASFSRETVHK